MDKVRWFFIRLLLTRHEQYDLLDICPEAWYDYAALIRGED